MGVIGQHEQGAPLHARRDVRAGAAAALIVLLLAFAAGRLTAPQRAAEPELRPASGDSSRLQLPELANAAPLPGLAAVVARPAPPAKKKSSPAKRRPRSSPAPVVIVGTG
jgi:hypothetical protein